MTGAAWELRPARAKDRETARSIHHAAYEDVVTRQFGNWDLAAQDGFFEAGWDGHENSLIVVDGQPRGYCTIERGADSVHVRELVIHPDAQGRGIGTAILRSIMDAAAERAVPVELRALHENRARRLYERLGFVTFDSTETHVLMRWRPGREDASRPSARSFDHLAEEFDFAAAREGRPDFVLAQLPERRGRALDVGCGSGILSLELSRLFDSVLAVDISEPMLEIARRKRPAPNLEYRRADANLLDVDGVFDAVVSHTTLHHMTDLPATLERLRSLVAPGGRLIVVDIVKGWLPIRPAALRLSAVWDFSRDVWKHGAGPAMRMLRFRMSRAWVEHVRTDTFLTPARFRAVYEAALPGCVVAPTGSFMSVVWHRDED